MSVDSGKGWVTPAGDRADLDGLHQEALMRVLHSPAAFGQLVTRSFGFTGSRLHLNCATTPVAAGPGPAEVRVEVLTSNHRKIEGFTFDDADPITQSGQDHVVAWNGNPRREPPDGAADQAAVLLQECEALLLPVQDASLTPHRHLPPGPHAGKWDQEANWPGLKAKAQRISRTESGLYGHSRGV